MSGKLNNRRIVLGVSGGIAAYKAADLAGKLTAQGAKVSCILTANACELVTPKTFEAVTGQGVFTSLWSAPEDFRIGHVELAQEADVVVVAPATANIIGKVAHGICDDLLSTTLCAAWQRPVIFAPAMNTRMWNNPAVQRNVETLRQMGFRLVGPGEGRLACGEEGPGRMAEVPQIIEAIEAAIA